MESRRRYKRFGWGRLLVLVILLSGFGWRMYAWVHQKRQERALIEAINKNDLRQVRSLLDQGVDPNIYTPDDTPYPPLFAWIGLPDNRPYQMFPKVPALAMAAMQGADITRLLLERGANVNATDKAGNTALIWCANFGPSEAVKVLLAYDANVNMRGYDRATALIRAAERANEPDAEVIRLLIAGGADVNARDVNGHTAIGFCRSHHSPHSVSLLEQAGAKE